MVEGIFYGMIGAAILGIIVLLVVDEINKPIR